MEYPIVLFIFIVLGVVAIVLISKYMKKGFKVISNCTVIVVSLLLGLFTSGTFDYRDINIKNVEYNFSINDLKEKYCNKQLNYRDSVKCYVILSPICDSIIKNYSQKELRQMAWNKYKMNVAIKQSIKKQKPTIHKELKKINALYLWNDFILDMKDNNFFIR